MIRIKIAKKEDAEIIALLGRITFSEAFGHLFRDKNDLQNYVDKTFSVVKIRSGLSKLDNVFWIAYYKELPVGYAKMKCHSKSTFHSSSNIAQLQKIYVLNDFLSKKIGKALQTALIKEAKRLGFEYIWLSVWMGNERAIHFYEKNNFEKMGSHTFTIGKETFDFMAMSTSL